MSCLRKRGSRRSRCKLRSSRGNRWRWWRHRNRPMSPAPGQWPPSAPSGCLWAERRVTKTPGTRGSTGPLRPEPIPPAGTQNHHHITLIPRLLEEACHFFLFPSLCFSFPLPVYFLFVEILFKNRKNVKKQVTFIQKFGHSRKQAKYGTRFAGEGPIWAVIVQQERRNTNRPKQIAEASKGGFGAARAYSRKTWRRQKQSRRQR